MSGGEGTRVAVALSITEPSSNNTAQDWQAWADSHYLRAVVVEDAEAGTCIAILPFCRPLPEAEGLALAATMVNLFGGESFDTAVISDPVLDVAGGGVVAVADGELTDFADVLEAAKAEANEAARAEARVEQAIAKVHEHPLEALNRDHAIVHVKGVAAVLTEHSGGISLHREHELHLRYAHDLRTRDGKKWEPVSKIWIGWKKRRTYSGGLGFWPDPAKAPAESYNLWRGWAVEPDQAASCELFLTHLRENVCHSHEAHYRWLLGWMAHLVQRPSEKPRSAIILKGAKGAGKDSVGVYLSRLLSRSAYLNTARMDEVTGTFNGLIANKLLVHLEEGFWSGDRGADSRVKNFITASTLTINEKFQVAYQVDSHHRFIVTSNEARVVNATEGERRYFISEVNPQRAKDKPFWNALYRELEQGGAAGLMHVLRSYDLGGWSHEPPATDTLAEHIVDGLRGISAWWYGILRSGDLPGDRATLEDDVASSWASSPRTVSVRSLYGAYADWTRSRRFEGDPMNDGTFSRELRKLCGDHVKGARRQHEGERESVVTFSALEECRKAFSPASGATWES